MCLTFIFRSKIISKLFSRVNQDENEQE
jgi:hypothetical protein